MISRSKCSLRLAISTRGNSFSWQKSCAASRIARSSSVSALSSRSASSQAKGDEVACRACRGCVVHASVSLISCGCARRAAEHHEGGHVVAEADHRRAEVVVAPVALPAAVVAARFLPPRLRPGAASLATGLLLGGARHDGALITTGRIRVSAGRCRDGSLRDASAWATPGATPARRDRATAGAARSAAAGTSRRDAA